MTMHRKACSDTRDDVQSIGSPSEPVENTGVAKALALVLRWRDSLQLQLCFGSTLDNRVSLDFPPFNGYQ